MGNTEEMEVGEAPCRQRWLELIRFGGPLALWGGPCRNRDRPPLPRGQALRADPGGLRVPGHRPRRVQPPDPRFRGNGWSMAGHLRTELVLDALDMAGQQRRPDSVVHHRDPGCQYPSFAFGERCRRWGPSMGSVGDGFDNAMAESFFASLECELLDRTHFHAPRPSRGQAHHQARKVLFELSRDGITRIVVTTASVSNPDGLGEELPGSCKTQAPDRPLNRGNSSSIGSIRSSRAEGKRRCSTSATS